MPSPAAARFTSLEKAVFRVAHIHYFLSFHVNRILE
jgi:hypothetical protein